MASAQPLSPVSHASPGSPGSPGSEAVNSPVALSHLVCEQAGESFLGVELDEGRFPIVEAEMVDGVVRWRRSDGGREFVDLQGSSSVDRLRSAFESPGGLLVISYPAGAARPLQTEGIEGIDLRVAFVGVDSSPHPREEAVRG